MNLAERMGMGPQRRVRALCDGTYEVSVTPPKWSRLNGDGTGFGGGTGIILSADQYRRYKVWLAGQGYIQDLLSDLTNAQREIIQTGICPNDWNKKVKD